MTPTKNQMSSTCKVVYYVLECQLTTYQSCKLHGYASISIPSSLIRKVFSKEEREKKKFWKIGGAKGTGALDMLGSDIPGSDLSVSTGVHLEHSHTCISHQLQNLAVGYLPLWKVSSWCSMHPYSLFKEEIHIWQYLSSTSLRYTAHTNTFSPS